jgi:hypothetical protein
MTIQTAVALALGLISQSSLATEQRIECPPDISPASLQLTNVSPEWRPFVSSPLFLHNAAPTNGQPETMGQMRGETTRQGKTSWTDQYSLEGRYPDGKWLQCDYGMLNEVALSKRLRDDTKECTVAGKKGEKAGQNVFAIVCN